MAKRKELPSIEWIKEYFKYHPDGYLIRIKRNSNATYIGQKVPGTKHHGGYRYLRMNNSEMISIHRVIFFMHHGYVPHSIDHIDRDKDNNRIENLRPASNSENAFNQKLNKLNKSEYRGVHKIAGGNSWAASIMIDGKRIKLGQSTDKKIAVAYYIGAVMATRGVFFNDKT